MVFWRRSHTLDGAALSIPCSYRTAQRYHSEFILLVAGFYGLLDEQDGTQEPKSRDIMALSEGAEDRTQTRT